MAGETHIRIEQGAAGTLLRGRRAVPAYPSAPNKANSRGFWPENEGRAENKPNWHWWEAENGDWPATRRACPERSRRGPRSGLYLPPLSDGGPTCKRICKAKPIFAVSGLEMGVVEKAKPIQSQFARSGRPGSQIHSTALRTASPISDLKSAGARGFRHLREGSLRIGGRATMMGRTSAILTPRWR